MKFFLSILILSIFAFQSLSAQWQSTGGPEESLHIYDLVEADTFMVALTNCGIYKRPDGGHWELVSDRRYELAAGFQEAMVVSNGKELRQVDLNAHWFGINVLNNGEVTELQSFNDTVLLLITDNTKFFYSKHSGLQMHYHIAGLPIDSITGLLYRMNSLATSNYHLFLATDTGVYRSDWDFNPWERKAAGLPQGKIDFVAHERGITYASLGDSLYHSLDSGNTWNFLSQAPSDFRSAIVGHRSHLYVTTAAHGVMRSADSGTTWMPFNTGLPGSDINFLKPLRMGLFACTNEDGYYFEDRSQWTKGDHEGMVCTISNNLAAGSNVVYHSAPNKISRKIAGSGWEDITPPTNLDLRFGSLLSHGDTLYVSAVEYNHAPSYKIRFLYSVDEGDSWAPFYNSYSHPNVGEALPKMTYNPATGGLYAFAGEVLITTDDLGKNFLSLNIGAIYCGEISDILFHDSTLYISTCVENRMFSIADNQINQHLLPTTRPIAPGVIAAMDSVVLVDRRDSLLISYDKGGSWELHAAKIENEYFYDLVITDSLTYAVSNLGIYASKDYGKTWAPMNDGLPRFECRSLVGFRDTLYTSTVSSGVYKYQMQNIFSIPTLDQHPEISFYPNPSRGKFFVECPAGEILEYSLHSFAGKLVQQGALKNNSHLKLKSASPGLYFVSFQYRSKYHTYPLLVR